MTKNVSGDKWRVPRWGKRQGTGAVQDALRGTGDHWRVWETHEIMNSVFKKGWNTANTGNTGFFEHTSLSRRLSKPSRQTREIEAHREKSCKIVNQSCLESCLIVLYRVKNKESFFPKTCLGFAATAVGGYAQIRSARRSARPFGTKLKNHFFMGEAAHSFAGGSNCQNPKMCINTHGNSNQPIHVYETITSQRICAMRRPGRNIGPGSVGGIEPGHG